MLLKAAGVGVEIHADHLPHDCSDEEWLKLVGRKGWFALTRDRRIRYRANERLALLHHRVGLFVVGGGSSKNAELASIFVRTLSKIEIFIRDNKRPFIAHIIRPSANDLLRNPVPPGIIQLKTLKLSRP